MIDRPGLYPDLPEAEYHADPVAGGSLSSSGARALLPPSCPARFRYDQDNGRRPKRAWDLGHAAHRLVLGRGAELVVIEADNYRTNAAKKERDDAHAAGLVPLLAEEHQTVTAMADALRAHPVIAALLDPSAGAAEQTVVWQDDMTGVWCRARYDWLPTPHAARRLILSDYKTCAAGDLEALRKAVQTWGYHQQAAWYMDGARAVLGAIEPGFVFIAQEKHAPYLVTVFELDVVALRIGDARNRVARGIYARCQETGEWPAYAGGIALLSLPVWAEIQEGER